MFSKLFSRADKSSRIERQDHALGLSFSLQDQDPQQWLWSPTGPDAELARYLAQLVEEDLATAAGAAVHLSWENLYRVLDDPDHATSIPLLDLPQPASAVPVLSCRGSLADTDFTVAISWTGPGGASSRTPVERVGGLLVSGTEKALLRRSAYELAVAVAAFAKRPAHRRSRTENERAWGRIRSLATTSGARLDAFLSKTIVLTPETLDLSLSCQQAAGMPVVEVIPGVAEVPQEKWISSFDAYPVVQEHYDLPLADGSLVRIVPDESVRAVLQELKRMPGRRVSGSRAEAFLRNPYAMLGEAMERVVPPAQFEQARRAAQVALFSFCLEAEQAPGGAITAVRLRYSSDLEEVAAPADTILGDRHAAEVFAQKLEHALAEEATTLQVGGHTVELLGDAADQLTHLQAWLAAPWAGEPIDTSSPVRDSAEDPEEQTPDGTEAADSGASLDMPTLLSWSDVFDLSGYGERIEGIGPAQCLNSPFIAKKSGDAGWVPENMVALLRWTPPGGVQAVEIQMTETDLDLLAVKVAQAEEKGAEFVEVPGWPAPMDLPNAKMMAAVYGEIFEEAAKGTLDEGRLEKRGASRVPTGPKPTLNIKANIEDVDYVEDRGRVLSLPSEARPERPGSLLPTTRLKAHQEYGVAWLQHLFRQQPDVRGCIFADDMGLGKTLQLLTFIAWYLESGPSQGPVLVVAPVSLLQNWANEMARFFKPDFARVLTLYGDTRRALRAAEGQIDEAVRQTGLRKFLRPDWINGQDIVLTTYETLRDLEFSLSRVRWGIMICDEAQKIKTPSALVTRAAKAQNAAFKIACTGTPVENSLADLWCLFDFVQPGLLGALNSFCKTYRRPIEAETDAQREAIDSLRQVIAPQILRRLKTDVADLPPKMEDEGCRMLPLSPVQSAQYAKLVNGFRDTVGRFEGENAGARRNAAVLAQLHKLRLICADPPSLGGIDRDSLSLKEYCQISPKMAWLMDRLALIRSRGEKVIIFTEFRDIQRTLQRLVGEAFGIRVSVVNGDTSVNPNAGTRTRQALIDAFQETPGFGVILLSTTAVGFGVNVQAANHVIHFTRSWNPAKEDQATDRAYRIGQEKPVTVYYPTVTSPDFLTFEAKIDVLLASKRRLAGDMLNGADDISLDELAETFWG